MVATIGGRVPGDRRPVRVAGEGGSDQPPRQQRDDRCRDGERGAHGEEPGEEVGEAHPDEGAADLDESEPEDERELRRLGNRRDGERERAQRKSGSPVARAEKVMAMATHT